jgi:hypothetical protein
MFTTLVSSLWGQQFSERYAALLLTGITLFFVELMPKYIGVTSPEMIARAMVPPISVLSRVVGPLGLTLSFIAKKTLKLFGFNPKESGMVSEEELRLIVNGARDSGSIEDGESGMISGVLDLQDQKIRQIMQPRVEMVAVPVDATVNDVLIRVPENVLLNERRNLNKNSSVRNEIPSFGIEEGFPAKEADGVSKKIFLPGGITKPPKWQLAAAPKTKNAPPWVASIERFHKGESINVIAFKQRGNKKSIQPATVVGHILTAFTNGYALDLTALQSQTEENVTKCPSMDQCDLLSAAYSKYQIDVATNCTYEPLDIIFELLGPAAEKDHLKKSETQRESERAWRMKIKWYEALKRGGLDISPKKRDGN